MASSIINPRHVRASRNFPRQKYKNLYESSRIKLFDRMPIIFNAIKMYSCSVFSKLLYCRCQVTGSSDGWEYSPLFGRRYHARERRVDVVRRRRWRRKMVTNDPANPHTTPRVVVAGKGRNTRTIFEIIYCWNFTWIK